MPVYLLFETVALWHGVREALPAQATDHYDLNLKIVVVVSITHHPAAAMQLLWLILCS